MKRKGIVYLVGAGPGDPGLMTQRGAELLSRCDAVVYDALVNPILLAGLGPSVALYDAGKRGGGSGGPRGARIQGRINRLVVRLARQGKRVVRLKGGDPFLLARGGEEADYLVRHRIPFEVVPGVSSVTAVPAYAGIPLTHRGYSSMVTVVTGRPGRDIKGSPGVDWERISPRGTLVVLMGAGQLAVIARRLSDLGWKRNTPIAAIQWGTTSRQRVFTGVLGDFAKGYLPSVSPPAVIVVGDVVSLRSRLDWLRNKPLFGRSVVVTRAADQSFSLCERLREAGAEVLEVPVIETRFFEDTSLKSILDKLTSSNGTRLAYDWIVFTSANGARYFDEALQRCGRSFPRQGPKVCAVGPATAEMVKQRGFPLTRTARVFTTSAIPETLGNVKGRKILLARVRGAPPELKERLLRRGALVESLSVYETVPVRMIFPALRRRILEGVDWVTFTSSSTARSFMRIFSGVERKKIFTVARAASIGPVTSQALREYGIVPTIQALHYTAEGLVRAVMRRSR